MVIVAVLTISFAFIKMDYGGILKVLRNCFLLPDEFKQL